MSNVNSVSARPGPTSSSGPDARLEIDNSRSRQTTPPATPFRNIMAGGVDLLMAGAEVATHVVGGPVLAATVHDARAGAAAVLSRSAGPAPQAAVTSRDALPTSVSSVLQEGQLSSAQLLVLQQQIQQENQQFSTLSNVMRARHDMAKAAVSNIRA